jgi:thioredoxin 1
MPTKISAPLHFRTLLNAHTYLIADFYATWCPPCKQIAPIYNQLSSAHSSPGKFAFVKINVDEQREIVEQYGITAMPTFMLFRDGKKVEEVRGADVRALKAAVEKAAGEIKTQATQAKSTAQTKSTETKTPTTPETKAQEKKAEGEEKSVSGTYGMTGGNNWKMSLH